MTGLSPSFERGVAVVPRLLLAAVGAALPLYLDSGWVHLLVYPLAAAVASPLFCTLAFVVHALTLLFPEAFVFPVSCADVAVAGLALVLLAAGRLGTHDRAPQLPEAFQRRVIRPVVLCAYPVLLCWALLRTSSPIQALSLVCILASVHRATPSLHTPLRATLRGAVVNLVILAVSAVCAAVVLEGGARLVFGPPKGDNALWIPDQEYHFLLNPGAVVPAFIPLADGTKKTFMHRMSRQGFRDREFPQKAPNETRILLLGDSFTMGWGVDKEDTISNLLAKRCAQRGPKRLTFINGGMGAAGPFQELGMLKKRGLALEPDGIVLQLFLLNDLDDCLMTVGKSQRCFFEPFHEIADNLRKANAFPGRQEYLLRIHSAAYYQWERITAFRPWASRFLSLWRFLPPPPPPAFRLSAETDGVPLILDINREAWYPELEEGAALLVDYVRQMNALCQERKIPFAVYCIPDYNELDDALWSKLNGAADAALRPEKFRAIHLIEKRLEAKGIATFSVKEALEKEARAAGVGELYYLLDGHATARGNDVIAEQIWNYLALADQCQ